MKDYQKDLIRVLLSVNALSFGDFTLKSGRKSPYFINTGKFSTGSSLSRLAGFYAKHLVETGLADSDFLFGPAYKGIPLAVATASALFNDHKRDIGILFDRKEAKDHGDASGILVGGPVNDGQRIVMVEDVITAGTTMKIVVPFLRSLADVKLRGVIILVDRGERSAANPGSVLTASQEVEKEYGLKVYPILTIHQILNFLSSTEAGEHRLSRELQSRAEAYLTEYAPRM